MDSYYDILQVPSNATTEDIRKNYRRLVLQYHPDRQGGHREKFEQVQNAYEILSDETARKEYDEKTFFINGNIDLFTLLGKFMKEPNVKSFRKKNNNKRSTFDNNQKSYDIYVTINVTLEELCNGVMKTILYEKRIMCNHCASGNSKTICSECSGTGITYSTLNETKLGTRCKICRGNKTFCGICHNSGFSFIQEDAEENIYIYQDTNYVVKNAGHTSIYHSGDLQVCVEIDDHPYLIFLSGGDLEIHIEMDIFDIILGQRIVIPYLNNKKLNIQLKVVSEKKKDTLFLREGVRIPLPGYGVRLTNTLFIVLKRITLPTSSSHKGRQLIRKMRKLLEEELEYNTDQPEDEVDVVTVNIF